MAKKKVTVRKTHGAYTFEERLSQLADYKEKNGDINVPQRFKGYGNFGGWVALSLVVFILILVLGVFISFDDMLLPIVLLVTQPCINFIIVSFNRFPAIRNFGPCAPLFN
jgi:hypothetical protein